eukprot:gene19162-biopygen2478
MSTARALRLSLVAVLGWRPGSVNSRSSKTTILDCVALTYGLPPHGDRKERIEDLRQRSCVPVLTGAPRRVQPGSFRTKIRIGSRTEP